jgi:hypothetical protein
MRILVFAGIFLFCSSAFAESQLEVRVNRIEMAVTAPDESDNEAKQEVAEIPVKRIDASTPRASTEGGGYNSSRSNRTLAQDTDDEGDSVETKRCENGVDDDCDGPRDAAPANHNSTRSK